MLSKYMSLPPGYHLTNSNTCLRKPKREDQEVEAILGVNEYKPAIKPDSPQELRKKHVDLEQQVRELTAAVQGLTSQAKSAPIEVASGSILTYTELKSEAKAKGINTHKMKKAEIAEALRGDS